MTSIKTTITQALHQSIEQLQSVSDSAHLDAELLLCSVLNKDRSFLHTWPEQELEKSQLMSFQQLIALRLKGNPIAHILGQRGFWSLNLKVTTDTLIPRPETERLVELALDNIPQNKHWHILDLGTGSGAIGLAIAQERPLCEITATDQSTAALSIAKENAKTHHLKNIQFIESHWFENIKAQKFDMIVSNPPYICENDVHLSQGDVRFEPLSALTAGADGLNDIRIIIKEGKNYLASNAMILLEHGFDQADAVIALFQSENYEQVINYSDYNAQPRVTTAVLPK